MNVLTAPQAIGRILAYHWLIYRRTWRGTVVLGVANPILFLTGMGIGIGALIRDSDTSYLDGSYLAFLAPGMMAAAAMQIGYVGGGFAVYHAVSRGGSYTAAIYTPTNSTQLMIGHQLATAMNNTLFMACFYVVALVLGATSSPMSILMIPAALLTGAAMSAPVAAWAVTVRQAAQMQAVFRIVIQPLYLLSGTFFPLTTAPGWVQKAAWVSPLWHGVVVCRALNAGHFGPGAYVHLGVLIAFVVVGLLCARVTYARRLYQ